MSFGFGCACFQNLATGILQNMIYGLLYCMRQSPWRLSHGLSKLWFHAMSNALPLDMSNCAMTGSVPFTSKFAERQRCIKLHLFSQVSLNKSCGIITLINSVPCFCCSFPVKLCRDRYTVGLCSCLPNYFLMKNLTVFPYAVLTWNNSSLKPVNLLTCCWKGSWFGQDTSAIHHWNKAPVSTFVNSSVGLLSPSRKKKKSLTVMQKRPKQRKNVFRVRIQTLMMGLFISTAI